MTAGHGLWFVLPVGFCYNAFKIHVNLSEICILLPDIFLIKRKPDYIEIGPRTDSSPCR